MPNEPQRKTLMTDPVDRMSRTAFSPEAFTSWMKRMGINQMTAARILGCSEHKLRRMKNGGAPYYIGLACAALERGIDFRSSHLPLVNEAGIVENWQCNCGLTLKNEQSAAPPQNIALQDATFDDDVARRTRTRQRAEGQRESVPGWHPARRLELVAASSVCALWNAVVPNNGRTLASTEASAWPPLVWASMTTTCRIGSADCVGRTSSMAPRLTPRPRLPFRTWPGSRQTAWPATQNGTARPRCSGCPPVAYSRRSPASACSAPLVRPCCCTPAVSSHRRSTASSMCSAAMKSRRLSAPPKSQLAQRFGVGIRPSRMPSAA